MQITRGVMQKPLRVVVYGPEGIGKTTFASQFPKPLFIDTEYSTEFLDVDRLPKPSSWTMLLQEVDEAKKLTGTYQTLVLDTADWAEALCKKHVVDKANVDGIEAFGYGKGYVYVMEEWGRLLNKLSELRDAGLNVVLTAHAAMRKFEQPDEMGAYDRWELKLEKRDSQMTKEWADMVLFANYETYVVKDKEKAAKGKAQGGRRVMYTAHHPCWDAKNRQGLPDKLPFEFGQIARCLPGNSGTIARQALREMQGLPGSGTVRAEPPEQPEIEPSRHAEPAGRATGPEETPAQETPPKGTRETAEEPPGSSGTATRQAARETRDLSDETGAAAAEELPEDLPFTMEGGRRGPERDEVPKAVRDLMQEARVSEEDVRNVIGEKGYYPKDTPWNVLEADGFVDGWVLPFWDRIVEMIKADPHWLPM